MAAQLKRIQSMSGVIVLALSMTGCATWPVWFKPEDPRIAEACTSIRNVTEKNYKLGASISYLLVGLGVGFEKSGVALTNEMASYQMDQDRICRQRVKGEISEESWLKASLAYASASSAAASRSNDPAVLQKLKKNLEELQIAVRKISEMSPRVPGNPTSVTELDLSKVMADAQQMFDSELSARLKALNDTLGGQVTSIAALRDEFEKAQMVRNEQEFRLLGTISALQKQVEILSGPRPKAPEPVWKQQQTFRITFAFGASTLSEQAKSTLQSDLGALPKSEDYRVELFGYADTSGSPGANAALSSARAQETRDFLTDVVQLAPSKILAVGHEHGVSKFGAPKENRIVEVRAFVLDAPRAVTEATAVAR